MGDLALPSSATAFDTIDEIKDSLYRIRLSARPSRLLNQRASSEERSLAHYRERSLSPFVQRTFRAKSAEPELYFNYDPDPTPTLDVSTYASLSKISPDYKSYKPHFYRFYRPYYYYSPHSDLYYRSRYYRPSSFSYYTGPYYSYYSPSYHCYRPRYSSSSYVPYGRMSSTALKVLLDIDTLGSYRYSRY